MCVCVRVCERAFVAVAGILRGGGRYFKVGAAESKKATKSSQKVKRLEEEVMLLRQHLDTERKRSALLEHQVPVCVCTAVCCRVLQ